MGFLRRVRGIFMILVGRDTAYPIFTHSLGLYLAPCSVRPRTELCHELLPGPAVARFLLISAATHFDL